MKRASRSAMHHIPVGGMNKIQVGYCGRDAVQYPGKGDFTDSYLFFFSTTYQLCDNRQVI